MTTRSAICIFERKRWLFATMTGFLRRLFSLLVRPPACFCKQTKNKQKHVAIVTKQHSGISCLQVVADLVLECSCAAGKDRLDTLCFVEFLTLREPLKLLWIDTVACATISFLLLVVTRNLDFDALATLAWVPRCLFIVTISTS